MAHDVIVLDGRMGKHLERSGAPFRQPEWSWLADGASILRGCCQMFPEPIAEIATLATR